MKKLSRKQEEILARADKEIARQEKQRAERERISGYEADVYRLEYAQGAERN